MRATAAYQLQLTEQLLRAPAGAAVLAPPTPAPILLDRAACLEFAVGSIGAVLGEAYAAVLRGPFL